MFAKYCALIGGIIDVQFFILQLTTIIRLYLLIIYSYIAVYIYNMHLPQN